MYPWDSEQPLDDMKHVEDKQNAGEPKTNHSYSIEERSTAEVRISRHLNTNKAQEVENLNRKWLL